MLNLFKKAIVNSQRAKARYALKSEDMVTLQHYQSIPVFTSDNFIFGRVGIKGRPHIQTIVTGGSPTFMINEYFGNLKHEVRNTFLAIEKAHIELGHYGHIQNPDILELQKAADIFATEFYMADIAYALSYVRDNCNLPHALVAEYNARIYAINHHTMGRVI